MNRIITNSNKSRLLFKNVKISTNYCTKICHHSTFVDAGLTFAGKTGISTIYPTTVIETLYSTLIESLGLSWYTGIPIAAIILRLCLVPIQISNQKFQLNHLHKQRQILMKIREKQKQVDTTVDPELWKRYDLEAIQAHSQMMPPSIIFRMFPTMICQSSNFYFLKFSMQNIDSGMATLLPWSDTSLALTDPFYLLPLSSVSILYYAIHTGTDESMQVMDPLQKELAIKMLKIMAGVSLIFTSQMPACISLFLLANGLLSLGIGKLLMKESTKEFLKFPKFEDQKILEDFMKLEMKMHAEKFQNEIKAKQQAQKRIDTMYNKEEENDKKSNRWMQD